MTILTDDYLKNNYSRGSYIFAHYKIKIKMHSNIL